MKLPIEQWIAERHYSENVNELFKEAVICYRNGAYRASLLLSYLGLLTIVKETMLHSPPPAGYDDATWRAKLLPVQNHDSWEGAVFDSLVQIRRPIFRLTDDLRDELRYWRNRRNDAAHYKDNEIGGHHTESLWSFIKSNVPKMAVDGGMEGLLNKFTDHFDEDKTPPGTDFKPLVREIPSSVLSSELPDFFKKLPGRVDGRPRYFKSETGVVLNEVFNLPNEKVIRALTSYLKESGKERDLRFLDAYPNRLSQMGYSATELRLIWKKRMFTAECPNPFTIYCELLRNNYLNPSEIEEGNQSLYDRFDQRNYHHLPTNEVDYSTLLRNGFYKMIYEDAILTRKLGRFMWVNEKCDLIASMIEYAPLEDKTVETICVMAESSNPSQWLVRELNELFERKPTIKTSFEAVVAKLGISLPADFS